MSFPLVEAAMKDFELDLARAERLLDLIIQFREFGSSAATPDAAAQWDEARELHSMTGPVRTDLPVFSGSILLYLVGRFEYFVAETTEVATDILVASATTYDALPTSIRKHLRSKTLDVAREPRKYRFEDSQVNQLLDDLVQREKPGGSPPFNVNSKLISMTDNNMRADTLDEVLRRLGVEKVWDELGKQVDIKLYFGGITGDGQCKEAARRRLNDLIGERNDVAHPTGGTNFPSAEEVLDHVRFLLLLARGISAQILLYLTAQSNP